MSRDYPFILTPSLLSSDFSRIGDELAALEQAGLEWVHWDVMDGAFVPNITFGPPVIKACRQKSKLFFDVHLMIEQPDRYLGDFVNAGANLLCVHAEACTHLERTVSEITRLGAKCGVALNPHTPLDMVEYLLPQLDMVLIMSVNPGFGGQKFIPFTKGKMQRLRAMIQEQGGTTHIQVDGGVTPENIRDLADHGANVFVSGSAFFGFPPYAQRYRTFMDALDH
ncbi:ribulose-phosphate 3-epimerase [Desulfonatronum sp. SC1]|uniref:ribulose-phosphate 3-epimerase n=1 Tax=Desulfonatronum sp. SC1 TaxID=2109626 RepID=UPI000D31CB2C|nr:ribulose-phosphate 3-epimerase [Desulfonatronum sp. SC1]PTN36791.1 ribulose-phosphate 3-epimerase [Desulfonatronum sp. SC1]